MTKESVSSAIAERDNSPSGLINQYRSDFATVLPSQINPDQWVRMTMGVVRRNAQLANIAKRNPGSFLAAVLDAARLGLEIGDTYHLVPFGNEIVGIADYTGLIELAYRAGEVQSIKCEVVRSDDHFRYEPGVMDRPEHQPDWFRERGELIGAYAYALLKSGAVSQVVVRSKAEIEQVRDVSRAAKAKDGPWEKWPDRMWRKTVLRELMKFIPTSAEYRREKQRGAVEADRVATSPDVPPGTDKPQGDVLEGEVLDDAPGDWPAVAEVPEGAPDGER